MYGGLRRRRRQLGLSLEDLATRVGVSVATLSRVERGLVRIAPELATALATVLDVNVAAEAAAARLSQAALEMREALGQAILEDVRNGAGIEMAGWRPQTHSREALEELVDRGEVVIHDDKVKLQMARHPAVREAEEISAYRGAKMAGEAAFEKTHEPLESLWEICQDGSKHPPILLVGLYEMLRLTTPLIILNTATRPIPLSPTLVGNSLTVWTQRSVGPSEAIALIADLNLDRVRRRWETALAALSDPQAERALRDLWANIRMQEGLVLAGLWVAALVIEERWTVPETEEVRARLWTEIENRLHRALSLPSGVLDRLWEQLPNIGQEGCWITTPDE